MNIKIFNKNKIRFDEIKEKGGYENMINEFCDSVNVIDIVVLSSDLIVVKYKKFIS